MLYETLPRNISQCILHLAERMPRVRRARLTHGVSHGNSMHLTFLRGHYHGYGVSALAMHNKLFAAEGGKYIFNSPIHISRSFPFIYRLSNRRRIRTWSSFTASVKPHLLWTPYRGSCSAADAAWQTLLFGTVRYTLGSAAFASAAAFSRPNPKRGLTQ